MRNIISKDERQGGLEILEVNVGEAVALFSGFNAKLCLRGGLSLWGR